MSPECCY